MSGQNLSDQVIGGQLYVTNTESTPLPLLIGVKKITGASYQQSPAVIGDDKAFVLPFAACMIGPMKNPKAPKPIIPGALCSGNNSPYSLAVIGDAAIFDNLDVNRDVGVGRHIIAQGEVMSRCGSHILSAKKNFDIPHPTKEGWRLRHTCPEGPSNDVYFRGRVTNKTFINIPDYWTKLIDYSTITVSLTPIGAHQDVIVKRIDDKKIHLQAKGGIPIDCFYHVYAERNDGEKLIPEYEGESPADYPGNNDEYSISGYHYDIKEK